MPNTFNDNSITYKKRIHLVLFIWYLGSYMWVVPSLEKGTVLTFCRCALICCSLGYRRVSHEILCPWGFHYSYSSLGCQKHVALCCSPGWEVAMLKTKDAKDNACQVISSRQNRGSVSFQQVLSFYLYIEDEPYLGQCCETPVTPLTGCSLTF